MLCAALLFVFSTDLSSQLDWSVKTDPLRYLVGDVNMHVEARKNKWAGEVGLIYGFDIKRIGCESAGQSFFCLQKINRQFLGGEFALKFNINKRLYLGILGTLGLEVKRKTRIFDQNNTNNMYSESRKSIVRNSLGFLIGNQFTLNSRLFLEPYFWLTPNAIPDFKPDFFEPTYRFGVKLGLRLT